VPSGCRHPPQRTFMGSSYPSESCRLSGPRSHWVPRSPSRSVAFPSGETVPLPQPSPAVLRSSGSSSRGLALPCKVLPSSCPPLPCRWKKRLPWGFVPSWRRQLSAACTEIPTSALPSTAFLTPTTASAPISLAGLFHPAATSRVPLFRGFPLGQVGPSRRRTQPSCRCLRSAAPQLPARRHTSSTRLQGLLLPEVRGCCVDG
jgi:hypothetical protein